MEDKAKFVAKLFEALKETRMCKELKSLDYVREVHPEHKSWVKETIHAEWESGYVQDISVDADSCWMILKELIRDLG